jgi:hypothetical protein
MAPLLRGIPLKDINFVFYKRALGLHVLLTDLLPVSLIDKAG